MRGSDRRLGHRSGVGRCRRRPGELNRGRDRGGHDVDLFPPLRALCRHQQRIVASTTGAMEAHIEHRAACWRRIRHHIRQHGGDLLCAAEFRRRGSGRLWHWPAPIRPDSYAGDIDSVRSRRNRGSDLGARVLAAIPAILFAIFIVVQGGLIFALGVGALGIVCLAELYGLLDRAPPARRRSPQRAPSEPKSQRSSRRATVQECGSRRRRSARPLSSATAS